MTGIEPVTAALLASRIDSLLEHGVGAGASAAGVGTPATSAGEAAPAVPVAPVPQPAPPASTQTALSDVARVLDAISRYGGEATPVVLGSLPLLALPPAPVEGAAGGATVVSDSAAAAAAASSGASAPAAPAASATSAASAASVASAMPTPSAGAILPGGASPAVAALAAALARAVGDSGLFYESHLAQWLAGQRPLAALAREPQVRLTAGGDGMADVDGAGAARGVGAVPDDGLGSFGAQSVGVPGAAAHALGLGDGAADALLSAGPLAGGVNERAGADAASGAAGSAALHPATLPLVRQQLDLLATGQFRWSGDAWPGTRLDWSIEPDRDAYAAPEAPPSWRTRLTLALPVLGTVDAELVLSGRRVIARLRATEAGAQRLDAHREALRQRLAGAGLDLGALSIGAMEAVPDGDEAGFGGALAAAGAAAAYRDAAASVSGHFGGAPGHVATAGGPGGPDPGGPHPGGPDPGGPDPGGPDVLAGGLDGGFDQGFEPGGWQ